MSRLVKPEFLEIVNRFENDIDLLRQQCSVTVIDPEGSKDVLGQDEYERKLKLALELDRTISYTMCLSYVNYYKFRKRCIDEGYTLQEGFNRLVESFVNDKLVRKED